MRRVMMVLTAGATVLAVAPAAYAGPAGSTTLLTIPTGLAISPGTANNSTTWSSDGEPAAILDSPAGRQLASANGRYVVFVSTADGMAPDDDDQVTNVYVRDTLTNTTTLVSRADGPAGAPANGFSDEPAISADGTTVAFVSAATNLFGAQTSGTTQIYVRDIVHGTTELISRATGGAGAIGNDSSREPSIDDDGDVVAFSSFATNLGGGSDEQVYVRDGTTTSVVSTVNGSSTPGNDRSSTPSISGNGNFVAFTSDAVLEPNDTNAAADVYRRTLANQTDELASRQGLSDTDGNKSSSGASVSDDGTVVAFTSSATNLDSAIDSLPDEDVYVHDFGVSPQTTSVVDVTEANKVVPAIDGASNATISANGNTVSFLSDSADLVSDNTHNVFNLYVHTISSDDTQLASRCLNSTLLDQPVDDGAVARGGNRVYFATQSDGCSTDIEPDFDQVYSRVLLPSLVEATSLISRPTGTGALRSGVNASSINGGMRSTAAPGSISADGRFTVFTSASDELAPDDNNAVANVFVRDAQTDTTTLVDRASGANGAVADPASTGLALLAGTFGSAPVISADGHVVAFASSADDLVPGDTNGRTDVFVRNLVTDVTTRVSVNGDGTQAMASATEPALSADGNRVAFISNGELTPADPDTDNDVYVRDIAAGTTTLVSRADGPSGADANDEAFDPAISGDGSRVAFTTDADNLVAPALDANGVTDVYVRDLAAGTTVVGSARNGTAAAGNQQASGGSLDTTGAQLAFTSDATNIAPGPVDANAANDVFVHDLGSLSTTRVSRDAAGATGNAFSDHGSISGDGTRVAFETAATDLFAGDTDQDTDVLIRDLAAGTTTLVSRADGVDGALPDASATSPALSANGHCVAFDSTADNLVPGMPAGTDFTRSYLRAVDADCPVVPVAPISPAPPPPPPPPAIKLTITKLALTHATFRDGPTKTATTAATKHKHKPTPIGTAISYTLSEKASVSIVVQHKLTGRKRKGTCLTGASKPRHGASCTKYVTSATLKRNGRSGANKVAFSGRIGTHKLAAGSYRFAITATDAAHHRSTTHHISFRIVTH